MVLCSILIMDRSSGVINLVCDPISFFHPRRCANFILEKINRINHLGFVWHFMGGRRKMNCSLSVSENGIVRLIYVALLTLKIDSSLSVFNVKITLDFYCTHSPKKW